MESRTLIWSRSVGVKTMAGLNLLGTNSVSFPCGLNCLILSLVMTVIGFY